MKKVFSALVIVVGFLIHSPMAWGYKDTDVMLIGTEMCDREYNWWRGHHWDCRDAKNWVKDELDENCDEKGGNIKRWRTSYEYIESVKLVTVSGLCRQ